MRDRIKSVESILSAVGEDAHEGGAKNQFLLAVTTILFVAFVIAEIIGALAGNSLALLGDASAMSVDIFSYICCWYGEHIKAKNGGILDESSRMLVEVYIPTLSLCALLGVSGYVCYDAVTILLNPNEVTDEVSVVFLYAFSGANMVVDMISMMLFYFQRHAVFVKGKKGSIKHSISSPGSEAIESLLLTDNEMNGDVEQNTLANAGVSYSAPPMCKQDEEIDRTHSQDHDHVDINMASALTHVGGDSMRTLAVFVSAVITSCGVNGTLCDAWATIAVTVSIAAMVIPLVKEIYRAFWKRPSPPATSKTSTAYEKLIKEKIIRATSN